MQDNKNVAESYRSPKEKITPGDVHGILEKVDQAALIVSDSGDFISANSTFLDLFNVSAAKADKHKVFDESLHIITEKHFYELMEQTKEAGGKLKYLHDMKYGDEDHCSEVTIIEFHTGEHPRFLFLSKDISELKRSQAEAEELNRMLKKIIDNLPAYLFVKDVDDDFRYLIWNKAFAESAKIPAEKVIGRTDFEIFPDYQDAQQFREDDLKVVETGEMTQKHETYMAADGKTRVVQTYKTLVPRNNRGPLLVGISLDITDIQGIEEELVKERLRAEESDRLKSRFLANMSHEIRTPLNAIVGFSNMLSEVDEETREQFLKIINENTELLLQLINDILDLSKIEAGELDYTHSPMDLYDMCNNMLMTYENRMPQGVKLVFDNASNPSRFIINEDRKRLMQVLDNLLNNASKFTTEGEIHYGFRVDGDEIEVYVSDTGRGIPADKFEEIFERFAKLDTFVQGTGLGLSICKQIVERLGGEMKVESEEGRGSTFSFTIPYENDRSLNAPGLYAKNAERNTRHQGASDHVILVAEDITSNFLVIKALIKDRHEILWARDGREAVEMAREKNPDLILMDIKMPVMNGLDAAREIRSFNKDVPIVAITANAFDEDRVVAEQAGMDNFLPKPVHRDAFEAILNAYL